MNWFSLVSPPVLRNILLFLTCPILDPALLCLAHSPKPSPNGIWHKIPLWTGKLTEEKRWLLVAQVAPWMLKLGDELICPLEMEKGVLQGAFQPSTKTLSMQGTLWFKVLSNYIKDGFSAACMLRDEQMYLSIIPPTSNGHFMPLVMKLL